MGHLRRHLLASNQREQNEGVDSKASAAVKRKMGVSPEENAVTGTPYRLYTVHRSPTIGNLSQPVERRFNLLAKH